VKDTFPEMERKFRTMLLAYWGEERLKMGCSVHATAQALIKASLLGEDPGATPTKMKQALFLHFYGNDFGPRARKRILLALRKAAEHDGKRKQKVKQEARKNS
jgi:hypothetical protein